MNNYILNPNLKISHYAEGYFAYDARVSKHPLVEIPTQKIEGEEYTTLEKLKTRGFFIGPRSREEILDYFSEENLNPELIETFIRHNFIKEYASPEEAIGKRVVDFFNARYAPQEGHDNLETALPFEENDANLHLFASKTFFNLPQDIDPQASHVGLLGFPHASLSTSMGTEAAPTHFRINSRSLCWFDIHKNGVYSEIVSEAGRPEILCKDTVLKDFGDWDFQEMTLSQMLDGVEATLKLNFLDTQVYPLILGGDHAITYPILMAFLNAVPNLGLLHLDAHNDLFYTSNVVYSHAAPISNLLKRSKIERILSFGLRTFSDKRVNNMLSIYDDQDASERVRSYAITHMKQLIMAPGLLENELETMADRPYYLTIDLDVLSENAIGRQLSTPAGSGLEWHELFCFLEIAFRKLRIIGCDIVEYNNARGEGHGGHTYFLNSLLLLILDRLAKNNPKFKSNPGQV